MLIVRQQPVHVKLTCEIFATPGYFCPIKRAFNPLTVPGPSTVGEDGVLAFFTLPLLGFFCHRKSCVRRKVLLPVPFLKHVLIELFALKSQQYKNRKRSVRCRSLRGIEGIKILHSFHGFWQALILLYVQTPNRSFVSVPVKLFKFSPARGSGLWLSSCSRWSWWFQHFSVFYRDFFGRLDEGVLVRCAKGR